MSIMGVSGYNPYSNGSVSAYGSSQRTPQEVDAQGKPKESEAELRAKKRSGLEECETCKNRKYQDGSNEGDVSFKAPGHISPQASAATVASHEAQHVSNAYEKAGKNNGEVLEASVTYKMDVCPECGRSYVSGGETSTTIRYREENPYGQALKASDAANGAMGANVNAAL